ncbi:Uncharacterised protein [Mycobacteroides abscessus subsp. abscessus]|nr:Uncharacterised protein [Mycobacteroides abscessus subsp. abscessus]
MTDTASDLSLRSTRAVHPGSGSVRALRTFGRVTVSAVVAAVSDSVGTRKVTTEYPPWAAPGASAVTCAAAVPPVSSTTPTAATAVPQARERELRMRKSSLSEGEWWVHDDHTGGARGAATPFGTLR